MSFSSEAEAARLFDRLGITPGAGDLDSTSPIDGGLIGRVNTALPADVAAAVGRAQAAFQHWRMVPAPRRGDGLPAPCGTSRTSRSPSSQRR